MDAGPDRDTHAADIEDGVSEHGGAMMLPYFDFFAYPSSRKSGLFINRPIPSHQWAMPLLVIVLL